MIIIDKKMKMRRQLMTAILSRTYSSPTKKYILLCNKAQTDGEIKGCEKVHGNNKQLCAAPLPNHQSPCFCGGGGLL
jgi:hypothetical protein